jgi:hypothetical protein
VKILLRNQDSKRWEAVESADYSAEHELQRLLAETPSLIPITELREGAVQLVAAVREVGLPGSGTTDILAFSAEGDIAVVECKLAANSEIKRKVIAQLLEYGAYLWGMTYSELDEIIAHKTGKNLAEFVNAAIGEPSWDEEAFRKQVQVNLEQGAFILVIAVDAMNDELIRTIRYLNNCGNPSFIFTSLEMRRFQRDQTEILVPHLFELASSTNPKSNGKRKRWTEARYFQEVDEKLSTEMAEMIRDIYKWSKSRADRVWLGIGEKTGSYTYHYLRNGKTISVFSIYTTGEFILNYHYLSSTINATQMQWFHQALISIPAFQNIQADFKHPQSIQIEHNLLKRQDDIDKFKEVVEELGKRLSK